MQVYSSGTARLPYFDISQREVAELSYIIDGYMKHHIEGLRERKSERIFRELLSE
jgi:succinate dehydrogenase flavin-adding protein (antitoxin of CptAB toxin-antitoxin module)